jgi:hypothetical protein
MLRTDQGRQVGVADIQSLGYYPVERLLDWTYEEQAGDNERQPCFVLFALPSAAVATMAASRGSGPGHALSYYPLCLAPLKLLNPL